MVCRCFKRKLEIYKSYADFFRLIDSYNYKQAFNEILFYKSGNKNVVYKFWERTYESLVYEKELKNSVIEI